MARKYLIAKCTAAGIAAAFLGGCNTTVRNGVTVTVNGVNVSGAIGANSAGETVQKRFKAASVSTLKADSDSGSIEIDAARDGKDEIHVVATKTVHGNDPADALKKLLPEVTVQAELVNGALVLSSKTPTDFQKHKVSVSVDYVVTVPARLCVDLRTGSGSISVSGIRGPIVKIRTDYGPIDLKDIAGVVEVSTESGPISIDGAPDATSISAKSNYGNIALLQVAGNVDAETESGSIDLHSVERAASVKLHSGYGSVTVSGATGKVDASSSSGTVKVSDSRLSGGLTLQSDYGNVEATSISGAEQALKVSITTQSGTAAFRGEASELTLQSDYGSVEGELGSTLKLNGASLRSSSGAVSLILPASASAKIDATTSSGTVDLPNGNRGNSGSFVLGAGYALVKLESDYGNVSLRTK